MWGLKQNNVGRFIFFICQTTDHLVTKCSTVNKKSKACARQVAAHYEAALYFLEGSSKCKY